MLRQIVITFVVGTVVSVLTAILYTKYFHGCGDGRDVGDEMRALAGRWRLVAATHSREMNLHLGEGPGDATAYAEHRAYWLAYESCARRIEAVLRQSEAEAAAPEREGLDPVEYRARQPCECGVPKQQRRFRQDPALEPQCVPCWARGCLERATSGGAGPS